MIILSSRYLIDKKSCGNYELIKGVMKCLEREKKKYTLVDEAESIYSRIPLLDFFTFNLYRILNKCFNIKTPKTKKLVLKLLSLKYINKSDFLILDGYRDMFLALFWSKDYTILISSDLYSKAALSGVKNFINFKLFIYSVLIYIRNLILENTIYRILFKKVLFVSPLDKDLYNKRSFLKPNGQHLIFPIELFNQNYKNPHIDFIKTRGFKNILIIANLDQLSHQRDIFKFINNNYPIS